MKKLTLAVVLAALCALAASAADITGKWVAQIPGRAGSVIKLTFNFKQSGEKLTGWIINDSQDYPIAEGKVSGNTVSFAAILMDLGTYQVKTIYKGTIAGNEIKFAQDTDYGPGGPPEAGPPGRGAPEGGPPEGGAQEGRRGGRGPTGPSSYVATKAN